MKSLRVYQRETKITLRAVETNLNNLFVLFQRNFESLAVDLLQSCSESNYHDSQILLLRQIPEYARCTCIEFAVSAGAKRFVSHTSFQALLSRTWYGRISTDTSNFRVFLALLLPFLAPLLISLQPGESCRSITDRVNWPVKVIRFFVAYTKTVSDFLKAPVIKYVYNQVTKTEIQN